MADQTSKNMEYLKKTWIGGLFNMILGQIKTLQNTPPGSAAWGSIATGTGLSSQTDLQSALDAKADASDLTSHTGDTSNPHSVTKTQVGLEHVLDPDSANTTDYWRRDGSWQIPPGGSGGSSILTDVQGSRPAAGTSGRWFFPTDGYEIARDNGATWDPYIGGFKCDLPPDASSLTAMNAGTTVTIADDGDGLLITQVGSASTSERNCHYVTALGGSSYTLTCALQPLYLYAAPWSCIGLVVTNGTTFASHKAIHLSIAFGSSGYSSVSVTGMTNGTTDTVYLEALHNTPTFYQKYIWVRIRDNATTRYYEFSADGRNWETWYSHASSAYLTPSYVGLTVQQSTSNIAATVTRTKHRVVHWSLV